MSADVLIIENDLQGEWLTTRAFAGLLRDQGYTREVVAVILRERGCTVTYQQFQGLPALHISKYGESYSGEVSDLVIWLKPGMRMN